MDKIDTLQRKVLRRIENCNNPENRQSYEELERKYNIEKLDVRHKRSLLRMMYNISKDVRNINDIKHIKNLRSRKKVKLKNEFSGLTKLPKSP